MAFKIIFTAIVLLLLVSGSEQTTKELYDIRAVTTICTILDPTIVANFTCKSKNVNRTTNIGTKELIFQPDVVLTNYHSKLQLYRKFATSYRPFLITLDEDMCRIFADEGAVANVLNIKERQKYGNFYDPCPLSGRRYEERPMEFQNFPDILPGGEYRFEVIAYSIIDGKKRDLIRLELRGEIFTKKAEQW